MRKASKFVSPSPSSRAVSSPSSSFPAPPFPSPLSLAPTTITHVSYAVVCSIAAALLFSWHVTSVGGASADPTWQPRPIPPRRLQSAAAAAAAAAAEPSSSLHPPHSNPRRVICGGDESNPSSPSHYLPSRVVISPTLAIAFCEDNVVRVVRAAPAPFGPTSTIDGGGYGSGSDVENDNAAGSGGGGQDESKGAGENPASTVVVARYRDASEAMSDTGGSLMTDPLYPNDVRKLRPRIIVNRSVPGWILASSSSLTAKVELSTERIIFIENGGDGQRRTILAEDGHGFESFSSHSLSSSRSSLPSSRTTPTTTTFETWQSWKRTNGALYGGGQFQSGFIDVSDGVPIRLVQSNTEAIIPFFVSTTGYGLLWDNDSRTDLNPISFKEEDADTGGTNDDDDDYDDDDDDDDDDDNHHHDGELLITVPVGMAEKELSARWTSKVGGNICFFADMCREYSCRSGPTTMTIRMTPVNHDEEYERERTTTTTTTKTTTTTTTTTATTLIVQNWTSMSNLPGSMAGVVRGRAATSFSSSSDASSMLLPANKTYDVHFTSPVDGARLYVRESASYRRTVLQSHVGDKIDYYFLWGGGDGGGDSNDDDDDDDGKSPPPSSSSSSVLDRVIRLYRHVTGKATMYPGWAYGFWQSKERYRTQKELLDAAVTFREKKIPLDAIVQDWQYWGDLGWGPQWDPSIYPDPKAMVSNLSSHHIHLMVSVWSRFDNTTFFYKDMHEHDSIIDGSTYYDAWNPDARQRFYRYSKQSHFDIGIDALWLDATEPETFPQENRLVYRGSGNQLFNSYSLVTSSAISDGLRRDFPTAQGRRVFTLTRSSFAGQQRTGACLWSGDIEGTWDSLRRQVAASINYQSSGMPYWSEDIGGFFRPPSQYGESSSYRTLLIRWFQFGAFTPIFRVHGCGTDTELWNYGRQTQGVIVRSAIRLRYRLLPYTYSGFRKVVTDDWTMQRAMAFDFGTDDDATWRLADQFMFGSSILVAPILSDVSHRVVYLPFVLGGWIGFYSGLKVPHSSLPVSWNVTNVSIDEIPLFVRAGSILLMGPDQQYVGSTKQDPIEVRIYPGADGSFVFYEDDGSNDDYWTTIEFKWRDITKTLSVGSREGVGFDGMIESRTFHVFSIRRGHGIGVAPGMYPDCSVSYDGTAVEISLDECNKKKEMSHIDVA